MELWKQEFKWWIGIGDLTKIVPKHNNCKKVSNCYYQSKEYLPGQKRY